MENPEEILHSLEEFSKLKPKDIPRELEEYLCFVAKTGDPVYQWSAIKSLFREKLINVITEFYVSCPSMDIPPCPNVEMFNYDSMKNFILEKLDTFTSAPFTVQRICELLTTPRKEYNRIDKYMRALEKNILVVSTMEPGTRRNAENGDGIVNGIENEHLPEIIAIATATNDMMKDIDYNASWPRINQEDQAFINVDRTNEQSSSSSSSTSNVTPPQESRINVDATTSTTETVITCSVTESSNTLTVPAITITESEESLEKPLENIDDNIDDETQSVPAQVQKRRNSIEPITTDDDNAVSEPVQKIDSLELQNEAVVSSSETESSNSSCSNDTIHTDTLDKSENDENSLPTTEENQKINVDIDEETTLDEPNIEESTNLDEPNIEERNLEDTNFEETNLEDTNFEETNVDNTNLDEKNLETTNLAEKNSDEKNFEETNIEEVNLKTNSQQNSDKEEEVKVDIEISKEINDKKVDFVCGTTTSHESLKEMVVEECSASENKNEILTLPKSPPESPKVEQQQEAIENEPKPLLQQEQSEETPMEVDVENPDSTDLNPEDSASV